MKYLSLLLALLVVQPAAAQLSYDNWNFLLRAVNGQMTDSIATVGIRPDATADFDNSYDIPRPPRSPSGTFLEIYFPHSGGAYPPILGSSYAVDYQGPADPTWDLSVESSLAGPVTVFWDSAYVNSIAPRVHLYLRDLAAGAQVNMRTTGHYTFNYTVKRDFRIVGAIAINTTLLMEGFWNGVSQVQDTVAGYLAAAASPYGLVDSATTVLSTAGQGVLAFPNVPSASYYLVLRHRNHLEVWSAAAVALTKGTTSSSSYDFSAGAATAYGVNPLKQVGAVYVTWGGDVNQDGVVDYRDRNLTWNNRTLSGYLTTDCNGDNVTNTLDDAIVLANRLKISQHP
jgi:hypothetical protein